MKKLVMVETLSQFLIRYVVEVEDDIEHACDEVLMMETDPNFLEFSQKHLGINIISNREITKEEYLKIFDIDNDYLAGWDVEQKLKYINKIDYGDNKNDTNPCNET